METLANGNCQNETRLRRPSFIDWLAKKNGAASRGKPHRWFRLSVARRLAKKPRVKDQTTLRSERFPITCGWTRRKKKRNTQPDWMHQKNVSIGHTTILMKCINFSAPRSQVLLQAVPRFSRLRNKSRISHNLWLTSVGSWFTFC